jgi:hypothetical protein
VARLGGGDTGILVWYGSCLVTAGHILLSLLREIEVLKRGWGYTPHRTRPMDKYPELITCLPGMLLIRLRSESPRGGNTEVTKVFEHSLRAALLPSVCELKPSA